MQQCLNEKQHTWLHRQEVIKCESMCFSFRLCHVHCVPEHKLCEFQGFVYSCFLMFLFLFVCFFFFSNLTYFGCKLTIIHEKCISLLLVTRISGSFKKRKKNEKRTRRLSVLYKTVIQNSTTKN